MDNESTAFKPVDVVSGLKPAELVEVGCCIRPPQGPPKSPQQKPGAPAPSLPSSIEPHIDGGPGDTGIRQQPSRRLTRLPSASSYRSFQPNPYATASR